MNNDLLIAFAKKRHHVSSSVHHEYDEYPIIFSGQGASKSTRRFYKVGHDMKIKMTEATSKKKQSKDDEIELAKSLNIGYYLITPLLGGVFLGYWIDKILGTKPVFLLLFLGLGIAGAFYNLWKTVQETKK